MTAIGWHGIDREALALLLSGASQVTASAVGEATVYSLANEGRELLVIALPSGQAVIVEKPAPTPKRRRRADSKLNPASR